MGLIDRILGRSVQQAKPTGAMGNELVDLSCGLLAMQIDLGNAAIGGANRKRLETPYARGYIFGFIDAALQKGGIADETHALALLTVAHSKLFGVAMGSLFIGDALRDQSPESTFTSGRRVGAADLIRWLHENKTTLLMLADYLNGGAK